MEELKYTISRSFSRKLVPENEGVNGYRFAPLDFWCSHSMELLGKDADDKKVKEVSEKLHELANRDVELAYSSKLAELRALKEIALTTEEIVGISTYMQAINNGATSDEMKKMIEKGKLSDKQVDFLRKYFTVTNE